MSQRVVMIGGGLAGSSMAHQLLKHHKTVAFTIIEPSDRVFYPPGVPRVAAVPGWENTQLFVGKLADINPHAVHVKGWATSIDMPNKQVLVTPTSDPSSTVVVPFDRLIIATGSAYENIKVDQSTSQDQLLQRLAVLRQQVMDSNHVLVLGGGAVGIETACEIASAYPEKRVTIVHSGPRLMTSSAPKRADTRSGPPELPTKFVDKVHEKIATFSNITLVLNDRVDPAAVVGINPPLLSAGAASASSAAAAAAGGSDASAPVPPTGPRTIRTTTGVELTNVGVVIPCIGARLNDSVYRGNAHLHTIGTGQLDVDEFLQVRGSDGVAYAVGDVAGTGERMLAANIAAHISCVAKNLTGKKLVPYKSIGDVMFVTMGPHEGAGLAPTPFGSIVVGRLLVVKFKGGDFMLGMSRDRVGLPKSG